MNELTSICMAWPDGFEPSRAHASDAGIDLRARHGARIFKYKIAMVGTGVRVSIPHGYVGLLFARSSLCKKNLMLANGVGVIDSGYTGEIMVPLVRTEYGDDVREGERIAQLVIVPCALPKIVRVDEFANTERGAGGFGSTGA